MTPGTVTATDGPAEGETSVEIGVGESTSAGSSLQLVGAGASYSDFTWVSDPNPSFGEVIVHRRCCRRRALSLERKRVGLKSCFLDVGGLV